MIEMEMCGAGGLGLIWEVKSSEFTLEWDG